MKTLYKQYIVVTLVVIAASITLSMLFLGQIYNAQIRPDTDKENFEVAQEVKQILNAMPEESYNEYFRSIAKLGYQVTIANEAGQTTHYGTAFKKNDLNRAMSAIIGTENVYHGIQGYKETFFFMNYFANDVQNTIGVSILLSGEPHALFIRQDNATLFSEMHFLIVSFIIISAIIILGTMIFLARQLVLTLKQLQHATEQIAQENYDIQLNIARDDELGMLATQFQKMAKRLAENDQTKKDFINNVSHDFQSPLLNIQGYANVLKDSDNTEEEQIQYLEIIEQETKRLSALTKQLLLLSSLDQKNLPIDKKHFALDQQLKERLFSKRWKLDDRQMELIYELEPVEIYADEHLFEQVWDNLLSNAIRYSEERGKIIVTCSKKEDTVQVVIHDYGIGIPEEALEKVKERFYRVDRSRSNQSSGLGLAIVTEIVKRHEGELLIESELGKGTKVTIRLS
ncbi:HAMP domain-containing histidine kinase [Solibacillus sp. MA9]|uniref:Heme sensor protein HssS n=1 Tax=Solibacillus palustris TaxID=2908203 RepID=A0ABS9U7I6_9BACL|nr:HAMP domain-containing sensor histidine kinase [Solibacillus sp. MA9]MCH7320314.1 HAMP domain-containing histidine kinase [Solibacillus sp. MA9]